MHAIDSFTFTHDGRDFIARIYADDDRDAPWLDDYCHGEVKTFRDSEPLPRGWVVLHDMPRGRYAYNFGGALLTASRDGWGLSPEALARLSDRVGGKPTRGQKRAEAVRQDMAYLRGYCSDEWHYVGVSVSPMDDEGEPTEDEYRFALWGIESDCRDYIEETASDLARQYLAEQSRSVYAGATAGEA